MTDTPAFTPEELVEKTAATRLSAEAAAQRIREGAIVIDVRSDQRRQELGVIEGAHVLTKDEAIVAVRDNTIGRKGEDQPVVLFCMSERGTARPLHALTEAGIGNVYDVAGGFGALEAEGIPVTPLAEDAGK